MAEIGSKLHIKYDGAVKVRKDSTITTLFQNEPIRIKMSPKTWCSVLTHQTSAAQTYKVGYWEHGIGFVIEIQAVLIAVLFFAVEEAITEASTQSL